MEMLLAKKAKNSEQEGKTKEFEASQKQILDEGYYKDPQDWDIYVENSLTLCHTTALNVWDRIQELKKIIE